MDKESFYTMRTRGKKKIRSCMIDYEVAKWIYEKWLSGYSIRVIADALHIGHTTVQRSLKPFKRYYEKAPLEVPEWVKETINRKYERYEGD